MLARWIALCMLLVLQGCAMVEVRSLKPGQYMALKRSDVLSTGEVSFATVELTRVAGLDAGACANPDFNCITALKAVQGLQVDRKLAALAELWLKEALRIQKSDEYRPEQKFATWLEAARHAYAYLFYSNRTAGERAFEDRQTQVRDYYNHAVQEAVVTLFEQRQPDLQDTEALSDADFQWGDWRVLTDYNDVRMADGQTTPTELIRASTLVFSGLRSTYRRDGFGAELVAVMPSSKPNLPHSEMPSPNFTALLHFEGAELEQVLSSQRVRLTVHDPYTTKQVMVKGQAIPLAGNFTAGYGLWLARTDFATQSLLSLLGREEGISSPHIYLMQPYDPNRRVLLMLHGLASSPEAWVNVANEVLGDEQLRDAFQVWQVYYPTNMPISVNHVAIRNAVQATLQHFDPSGKAPASKGMVVIGHSMGGVIARLMVSNSGQNLLADLTRNLDATPRQLEHLRNQFKPLVEFEAMPAIQRAVFVATPHRGTDFAGGRIGRLVSGLIRLPLTVLDGFEDVLSTLGRVDNRQADGKLKRIPNSIDNLEQSDPFIRAAAKLPVAPGVRTHSIVARLKPDGPVEGTDDGVVPYWSAHWPTADSEKVITSGHSVQETAPAILELRRILLDDLHHTAKP